MVLKFHAKNRDFICTNNNCDLWSVTACARVSTSTQISANISLNGFKRSWRNIPNFARALVKPVYRSNYARRKNSS